MNKKIITLGIALVFLVGAVSASLVPFISNSVTGTGEIKSPVFYLDGSVIPIGQYGNVVYRNLSVNAIPQEENETFLFDGNRLLFISSPLGIEDFYEAKFTITFWAKTNHPTNLLMIEVKRVVPRGSENMICKTDDALIYSTEYKRYIVSCSSNGEIQFDDDDAFAIEFTGAGGSSEYWINTGKEYDGEYSRMEVTPG
ncbi:hypothetical protein HY450_00315 [Candidatus Pacearchaeota archaeon]|nr:hypothetical protein [Candidatus Pacearchaeota archaeon]